MRLIRPQKFCYLLRFWFAAIRDGIILSLYIFYTYLGLLWRWFFPLKATPLRNDVILITGSANGIGRQICLQLVSSGANKLVCWDISKRENVALVNELKSLGAEAFGYEVDVSDMGQIQRAASKVKEDVGDCPTIVINAASIMPVHNFLSHNPREITRVFSVNVYGPLNILREFLPSMIEKKVSCRVVTICSAVGLIGTRNVVAYSGTKHAINGVIESLRDEIRVHKDKPDIKFTTVYNTVCNTAFSRNVIHTRFPWIIPELIEPSYIAQKTVEGILYNKDYVYIPKMLNIMCIIIKLFPTKITWALLDYFNYYVEPHENTRMIGSKLNGASN